MVLQYYQNQKVEVKTINGMRKGEVIDFDFKLKQYLIRMENGMNSYIHPDRLQPDYSMGVSLRHQAMCEI